MRFLTFDQNQSGKYPICILVPHINKEQIKKEYIDRFQLDEKEILILDLHQAEGKKKTPMSEMKAYIQEELQEVLDDCKVQYLLIADAEYFKAFTKQPKTEANLVYILDSQFGVQKTLYVPNFKAIFYDPDAVRSKIQRALIAFKNHRDGNYSIPGADIIKFAEYPQTYEEIKAWLEKLLSWNRPLAIDIETFSLKHHSAGIGTITFCWSEHEGIAFPVDYVPIPGATEAPYGHAVRNEPVRALLRDFFKRFLAKALYHAITFDVYVLIYQLFMSDILDTEGLLEGLETMLGGDWDDTKLITYFATNSCAGNDLSLKYQAQEFSGNWAMDTIEDITTIPLPQLLQYNLVDGLSTWFNYKKHWPTVIADQQLDIYQDLFKPCVWDIIQMQLTGMPVNMKRAKEVDVLLTEERDLLVDKILSSGIVKSFEREVLDHTHAEKRNAKLKTKRIAPGDEPQTFNPNSDPQLRALLFEYLELPVINLTDSKLPSTDGETIEALLNRTENPEIKSLLESLQLFTIVGTLTTNFMPAILGAVEGPDGWHYLFGNFNLGGTLSGRLSSSGPNLQNLPSTGKGHPIKLKYAKLIKSCFEAPPGWLFCGIDFSSLEDRISALTTKDPNKLKVYTDGYDGHSLRAYAYWPSKMPDIDPDSVESINTIAKKYKPLRDKSKNPTFTLTYQGTYHALVKKYGFSLEEAKEIEAKYHDLYKVSDDWVNKQLDDAMTTGYIVGAFGLRLRTPLLKQVIRGTSKTPYEAEAEGRTAGNALGQSWCLLNSRAGMEFNAKVRKSKYRLDIRPSAQIHDAQYHLIRDDIETIKYANEHLVEAVKWQDHPDIWHDEVKLGGEFSIFWPNWNYEITIPNDADEDTIFSTIDAGIGKYQASQQA
jgi:DNA polymerase-1